MMCSQNLIFYICQYVFFCNVTAVRTKALTLVVIDGLRAKQASKDQGVAAAAAATAILTSSSDVRTYKGRDGRSYEAS
jgi:hypothetical protein